MVNTNLMGPIRTTKAFIPHFREKRAGLFINTTSIGGLITVPFNSLYHATKWALEGWSESMAFELNQFGIGMKIVEPGGMKTDFFTRSFDVGRHPAYDALVDKVMGVITDPKQMATYSTPEQIAEVVYEAATDGKDQLRYVAGADAKATYAARLAARRRSFPQGDQAAILRGVRHNPERERSLRRKALRQSDGTAGQPFSAVPRMLREPRTPWPRLDRRSAATAAGARRRRAVITFIGHATFLIQTQAGNLLTDPIYSQRAGPLTCRPAAGAAAGRPVRRPAAHLDGAAEPQPLRPLRSADAADACQTVRSDGRDAVGERTPRAVRGHSPG